MTEFTLIGAMCEATGHPSECSETVNGSVQQSSSHDVTVNGTQVATVVSADMVFSSHAHSYNVDGGCHDMQSHTIDPTVVSSSVTVNGSPMYLTDSGVGTDPGSGGSISITDSGSNSSVTE